jgi:hypothetical protein
MRHTLQIRFLFALVFFAVSMSASAEQTVREKGRVVYHIVKVELMEVGDVPGHFLGVAAQRGLVTTDTGEVGTWSTKVVLDLTNGSGPHYAYTVTTFEDQSTKITQAEGVTTSQPDGTSTFEGTFTYIGGTGRFAGIKGKGSYAGKRMATLTPGVPVDLFQDYAATYTLPSP